MTTGGRRLVLGAAVLAGCVVTPATAQAAQACSWTASEFAMPDYAVLTDVTGADDSGRYVVGNSTTETGCSGLVWFDGMFTDELRFRGPATLTDINSTGTLVFHTNGFAMRGGYPNGVWYSYQTLENRAGATQSSTD